MTVSPSESSPSVSPDDASSAFMPWTWCGASARCTVSPSRNQPNSSKNMRLPPALLSAALTLALVACEGTTPAASGAASGTLIIATGGDADGLLPPLIGNIVGKQAVDLMFMPVARLEDDGGILGDSGFEPALAQRWEWAHDSLSITFQ